MQSFSKAASLMALACVGVTAVSTATPAEAQFKRLGKILSDIETKTAEAEERAAGAERSVDQTERAVDTVGRVGQKLGIFGKSSDSNPSVDVETDGASYAENGDPAAYDYADTGEQFGEDFAYGADTSTEAWSGTFSSNHGELRLVQIGRRVYGDYQNRGYFEGCASEDGKTLRGTFQYNKPRSKHGFIEFLQDDEGAFRGTWSWTSEDVPRPDSKVNWWGERNAAVAPTLIHVDGSKPHFADNWSGLTDAQRRWVTGGDDYESCAAPMFDASGSYHGGHQSDADYSFGASDFTEEWEGTFKSNHGELRLVQVGRRVFGDYQGRGYFEGCTTQDGLTLRGTFQYNNPRSKHGFIEFRMDGDGFRGTWTWTGGGVPTQASRVNWTGARSSADTPALTWVDGSKPHFADNWGSISDQQRQWVLGSQYYDSCDPPEVDYDQ